MEAPLIYEWRCLTKRDVNHDGKSNERRTRHQDILSARLRSFSVAYCISSNRNFNISVSTCKSAIMPVFLFQCTECIKNKLDLTCLQLIYFFRECPKGLIMSAVFHVAPSAKQNCKQQSRTPDLRSNVKMVSVLVG